LALIFRNFSLLIFILLSGCNRFILNLESDPLVQIQPTLPLKIDWRFNARAGFGPDPPLIFGNTVIVSTRKGEVHLIELDSGKRIGRKKFGEAINGSAVLIDSILVVPVAQGRRMLAAYDMMQGQMKWRIRRAPIEVGITPVDSGGVFVTTDGTVERFNLADGQIIWTYKLKEHQRSYARPIVNDQVVIIAVDHGEIIALSVTDGSLQWTLDIGAPIYVTPYLDNETMIVSTTQGRLIAVNVDRGVILRSITLNNNNLRLTTASIDDGLVAVGGSDGILRLFELETGEILWETQCPDAIVAQPLIIDDVVYTASMGNFFYAFQRQTGELLQTIELAGRVKSSIGVIDHGLIILSEPRYVIKLSTENLNDEV